MTASLLELRHQRIAEEQLKHML